MTREIGKAPAYPTSDTSKGSKGMTLRQAYQMAAIQGLTAGNPDLPADAYADKAQAIAEEMIGRDKESDPEKPSLNEWT